MKKWEKLNQKFEETLQSLSTKDWEDWNQNQAQKAIERANNLLQESKTQMQNLILSDGFVLSNTAIENKIIFFDDDLQKEIAQNKKDLNNFEVFFIIKLQNERKYSRSII